jgi:hypothetical protein
MQFSPMLSLHIAGGTLGVLSGFAAAFLRKGSDRHRVAGNIFVISMLVLGATGAYLGVMKHQIGNAYMGIFTVYMMLTAWWTAKRRDGRAGSFDLVLLTVPLVISATLIGYGLGFIPGTGRGKGGALISGFLALIFLVGDVRMLVRGSLTGKQRLVRHLTRMCLALFAAAGSLFLARAHLFPVFMRKSGMLYILTFLPLLLIIFWRFRLRSRTRYQQNPIPHAAEAYSLRA